MSGIAGILNRDGAQVERDLISRMTNFMAFRGPEVRHPLIDIRMVDYLLALPVIPWLLDKKILRKAMTGVLPDAVVRRPKSPLAGDPGLHLRHTKKFQTIDEFRPVAALLPYVDRTAIPKIAEEADSNQLWINVRPFSLNQWLTHSHVNGAHNEL